ncbi:MAG: alanine:cation symporter family protein [Phycisphaerae bacterium]|nr:alanine:cation symporter family protein [Phycisphaerae bacterium]
MKTFKAFTVWIDSVVWTPYLFFLLLGCGLLFSIVTKFVQRRALTHGIHCIRGMYDRPGDTGHISHFQALCAALSATIGLGNIAGVATAVTVGGPGAVFWMWVVGFFGMAVKFVECTLAVMFRDERDVPDPSAPALVEKDAETRVLEYAGQESPEPGAAAMGRGEVRGGPMWYIQKAMVEPLRAKNHPAWILFKILAVVYAAVIAICSFGSGNMYQSWNVGNTVNTTFGVDQRVTGIAVAFLVSLVIIGGIRRIGAVASKLVPLMCVVYVLGALAALVRNAPVIPEMFALIFKAAFSQTAGEGAFAGIGVYAAFRVGLQRALFSNEAGQGSAAIAHSAARTEEPIREGVVASIGPFVDTLIICTMTALVILSTGVWNRPPVGTVTEAQGNEITVLMTADQGLPEILRAPHYADLADPDVKLWVLVDRPRGEAPTRLTAKAKALENLTPEALSRLSSFRMTLTREEEADDPEKYANHEAMIKPGQPVHLALDGAQITRFALDTLGVGVGRWIIVVAVCLFAFSTMISWSYYGEKGTEYLLGPGAILPYKILFVIAIFMGCVIQHFETVYNFADAMVGLTVFCNLPACLILLPTLVRAARHYFNRLDTGQMPRTR